MTVEVVVRRNIIGQVASRITPAADRRKARFIDYIRDQAKGYAPVDTGELRDSIAATDDGVEATADHAIYQEYGTRYQSGTPFLRPAARDAAANVNRFFDGFETEILT